MTFGLVPSQPREPRHPEQLRLLWRVERRREFKVQIITAAISAERQNYFCSGTG